ncbi:MAG: PQQ-dependent sugar dehydrogenase [Opitutaceae bacterium]|nr:PQQ-dependent sugar dehydrogenase [Opitutaceae bacterium]
MRPVPFALLPVSMVVAGTLLAAEAPRDPATLVTTLCAGCHGTNLTGGTAPNLLTDALKHGNDEASLLRAIRDGFPQTGMVGYAAILSPEEQTAMVAHIRKQSRDYAFGRILKPGGMPASATFKSERHTFRLETVADGLDTPWGITFLPDGTMLVSDRVGVIRTIAKDGKLDPNPIRNTPKPLVKQDGGYLDLIAHPDYARNGWLYLGYSEEGENPATSMTVIVRGRVRAGAWVDQELIFRAPQKFYYRDTSHYGCRFLWDKDGCLFFTIGERGTATDSQDLTNPLGKIHRIKDDGTTPPDNPFVKQAGAWPTIWSYGHRHPQGLQYHPVTGKLWSTEHGPRNGDELNRIEPGKNYGWPLASWGQVQFREKIGGTSHPGTEQPIVHWSPGIAPAAIEFCTTPRFPHWKNDLLVCGLFGRQLRRITTDGDRVTHQEVLFADQGRVRDVTVGPDGLIYVALNAPGRIARLVPAD